mmetsp:Transcript_12324/g.19118  ORF Transcript_12324/g.19118 Transcript_12324/m.19118 type:complete len:85 (+) Transcript_12324:822-1076(+)
MKTERLLEDREAEKVKNNNSFQFDESKEIIEQFNQLKKIIHCFTFFTDGKKILVANVIIHIMEEIRMDRKIKMVLKDKGVERYI